MDPISASSLQFALTAMFHIVFPTLTIGLIGYVLIVETLWVRTRDPWHYRQARFWGKIFALGFGIGVVTGVPLEFEFGTNFAPFSIAAGDFFGHVLGFETSMAFMLEAGFLGVMLFGWKRVSPRMHLGATFLVWLGVTLSAFWIISGNSWMQTPRGVELVDGKFVITDWLAAIFTPSFPTRFWHMYMAAIETGLFFIGAVSAWYLLKRREEEFFRRSFRFAVAGALLVAPLQVVLGDLSGLVVGEHQPAKLAAMEAHWKTNPPGEGAAWTVFAIPDQENQTSHFALEVPNALSLIAEHSLDGQVIGLDRFPRDQQPRVGVLFWSFRLMLAIGFFLVGLALLSGWYWWRGTLFTRPWLFRAWIFAGPLGFIAVEAGWVVAEVGRQPWVVYGMMRTRDALSNLPESTVWTSLVVLTLIYVVLWVAFGYFLKRVLDKGPALDEALPQWGEGALPARHSGEKLETAR